MSKNQNTETVHTYTGKATALVHGATSGLYGGTGDEAGELVEVRITTAEDGSAVVKNRRGKIIARHAASERFWLAVRDTDTRICSTSGKELPMTSFPTKHLKDGIVRGTESRAARDARREAARALAAKQAAKKGSSKSAVKKAA